MTLESDIKNYRRLVNYYSANAGAMSDYEKMEKQAEIDRLKNTIKRKHRGKVVNELRGAIQQYEQSKQQVAKAKARARKVSESALRRAESLSRRAEIMDSEELQAVWEDIQQGGDRDEILAAAPVIASEARRRLSKIDSQRAPDLRSDLNRVATSALNERAEVEYEHPKVNAAQTDLKRAQLQFENAIQRANRFSSFAGGDTTVSRELRRIRVNREVEPSSGRINVEYEIVGDGRNIYEDPEKVKSVSGQRQASKNWTVEQ